MFTTRNVVLGVIAVFVISLAWFCWSLFQPRDSSGLASDTYGTRDRGLRAMFEILQELGVPVERGLSPSTMPEGPERTIVYWTPATVMIGQEPTYLHVANDWLQAGGRIVVAPADPRAERSLFDLAEISKIPRESLFEALRRPDIKMKRIGSAEEVKAASDAAERLDPRQRRISDDDGERSDSTSRDNLNHDLQKLHGLLVGDRRVLKTRTVNVRCTGTFGRFEKTVKTLEIPDEALQVINVGGSKPDGRIVFSGPDGEEQTLVATYRVGQGELIVVGPAQIGENQLIARQDNCVLLAGLIAPRQGPVIFDEFYHGSTVRGNPLWLMTRPGFGLVTICLLLASGMLIWREAIFLGPPLSASTPSRRSIGEYVVAMGRFLNRGRASRRFLLEEVRSGVLHSVRHELGLSRGREQVEELAAVLKRRSPQRAAQLVDAVAQIDQALSQSGTLSEKDAIRLLQGISSCL